MVSLSELAKKAANAKAKASASESAGANGDAKSNQEGQAKRSDPSGAGAGVLTGSNGVNISPPLTLPGAVTPAKAPAKAQSAASKGGFNLGQAAANPAKLSLQNATANDDSKGGGGGAAVSPSAGNDLGALGDINLDDVAETRKDDTPAATSEIFADEIPVDKPTRELPAELEPQQQAFISLLDSVYDLHCDPDAVKSAIQTLMIDMRETPHLSDLIVENDVQIIVRRMSQILGFRKASATTKKTKRATSKSEKTKAEIASAFDEMLGDLKL